MIIWYQNYVEKFMEKKCQKKNGGGGGGNVGHDPMYLWAWGENDKKSSGFIINFHYQNKIFNVDLFKLQNIYK
jgi:hypothetical protein